MQWTESDSGALQRYNYETNGALLKLLRSRVPKTTGTTIEEVALGAKFKEGYEEAISDIVFALEPVRKQTDGSSSGFTSFS